MATYKNQTVTITGDAKQGDKGFDPNRPMVKIRHEDGREETVAKNEVTGAGTTGQSGQ